MPRKEVEEEVRGWVRKAENDFRKIVLVLPDERAPFDTVCFHAQQGAEKYLKALLTAFGIPFGRTHDLPELLTLLPDSCAVVREVGDLTELTDSAVSARYPGSEDEYDRALAEEMAAVARQVASSVRTELIRLGFGD